MAGQTSGVNMSHAANSHTPFSISLSYPASRRRCAPLYTSSDEKHGVEVVQEPQSIDICATSQSLLGSLVKAWLPDLDWHDATCRNVR